MKMEPKEILIGEFDSFVREYSKSQTRRPGVTHVTQMLSDLLNEPLIPEIPPLPRSEQDVRASGLTNNAMIFVFNFPPL